jgi:hypothetical protein
MSKYLAGRLPVPFSASESDLRQHRQRSGLLASALRARGEEYTSGLADPAALLPHATSLVEESLQLSSHHAVTERRESRREPTGRQNVGQNE